MRIIAGQWKGRPLAAPRGRDTRPTADRVREAVFSTMYSLVGDISGRTVLDLYAGSGALGLEALSRGAAHVVFVESDRRAASAITENLRSLGAEQSATTLVQVNVGRALPQRLGSVQASLLLADPPYRIDPSEFSQVLEALAMGGVLERGALVIYEHASEAEALWPAGFSPGPRKRYGSTAVSFATYEGVRG